MECDDIRLLAPCLLYLFLRAHLGGCDDESNIDRGPPFAVFATTATLRGISSSASYTGVSTNNSIKIVKNNNNNDNNLFGVRPPVGNTTCVHIDCCFDGKLNFFPNLCFPVNTVRFLLCIVRFYFKPTAVTSVNDVVHRSTRTIVTFIKPSNCHQTV